MERHMSNQSSELRPAFAGQGGPAKNTARRWMISGAILASALALASCGPDSGANAPSASTNVAAASTSPAAASAASTASSPSTLAPACPKVEAPICPAAGPAARGTAVASLAQPTRPTAHMSAVGSGGARRAWRHTRSYRHGDAYADRERRDWDLGRPWPGDRPRGGRRDHDGEGLTRGDRLANERDRHEGLLGGPGGRRGEGRDFAAREGGQGFHGGYRVLQEESRGFASSQSSHFGAGERVVEHYREEGRDAFGPCPLDCRGGAYRRFSYAGVDGRGYLVWPGKVEY
jgi:hypothetical protein